MIRWRQANFADAVQSRGSGTSGLPQSEWAPDGKYPVIGQGAAYIEGWTDREDLVVKPDPALVLYGGHTRRAKLVDRPFVPGPNVRILQPVRELDPEFLFRYLEQLKIESRGYADHFPEVRRHRVPIPPLPEQRRIATILDKAEALRTTRRATLAQLDILTQSLFLEMFGDPATNPMGWPVQPLKGVVKEGTNVTYGIVQAGEEYPGGVPYIRTGDIVDGKVGAAGLRHTAPAIAAKSLRSRVESGDIVMSIRATVGTTALVPPELDGANLTQGTARISPGGNTEPLYLLSFLRASGTQHWIGLQIKGATFREITLARLRDLPVALPPIELQQQFGRRVMELASLEASYRESLAEVDALFASIQHRAFRGEL